MATPFNPPQPSFEKPIPVSAETLAAYALAGGVCWIIPLENRTWAIAVVHQDITGLLITARDVQRTFASADTASKFLGGQGVRFAVIAQRAKP